MDNNIRYLSEKEVSQITGIAKQTLSNKRSNRAGIPYIKVGRSIRYNMDDVIEFMESRKIHTEDSRCNV